MWASDHRPIKTGFSQEKEENGRGCFCFDKRWISKQGIDEVVQRGWCGETSDLKLPLMERISQCRKELARWKHSSNTNSKTEIQRLKITLEKEISKMHPTPGVLFKLKKEIAEGLIEKKRLFGSNVTEFNGSKLGIKIQSISTTV